MDFIIGLFIGSIVTFIAMTFSRSYIREKRVREYIENAFYIGQKNHEKNIIVDATIKSDGFVISFLEKSDKL